MRSTGHGMRLKRSGAKTFCFGLLTAAFICCLCGCSLIYLKAQKDRKVRLYDKDLSVAYDQTKIKKSLTLDVLPRMGRSEGEMLSQSDSVVASLGRSKDGYKTWFTLVTFHEYELSVIRKYFFVVDEKVEGTITRGRGLRFDCEALLEEEDLDEIRSVAGAKQITLLKRIRDSLINDAADLAADTDVTGSVESRLDINVLLVKQVLETILRSLENSPALATRISDAEGVEFDHINFGAGKVRMWAEGNTAVLKIRLGALVPTFHDLREAAVERIQPPAGQAEQPVKPDRTDQQRTE